MSTVLIADDNSSTRALLTTIVTHLGHDVKEAKTGNEAIAELENWVPDLILCDLEMPDGDGLDVVAFVAKQEGTSRIPFLLVTAVHDYHSLRHRINEKGISADSITAAFSKPIDPKIFASSVASLLKTRH
jgi:CheY-like chemotaxis protein